ncbi:MAG: phosphoribosylformylglycinamidine synthase subunit PurS, partial [Planctomycetes bacterium]|nr:phosphoribosylformylglycinamidine synthase subunit PurS [Planctomycetota bacterium]
MKQWRFEIFNQQGTVDAQSRTILEDIKELGIDSIKNVKTAKVFLVQADFDIDFAKKVCSQLLTDPVCQDYKIGKNSTIENPQDTTV